MISEEEVDRRMRRLSEMRNLIVELRRSAWEEWRQGRFPMKPGYDVRSDVDYWIRLRDEKLRAEAGAESQGG